MLSLGLIGPWVTPREGTSGQRKGLGNSEAPIVRWGASEIPNGLGWAFCAQVLCHPCRWWCCQRRRARPSARQQCRLSGRPLCLCSRSRSRSRSSAHRAVSSSDRLCCFLSGAASPPSHSVLRNALRAASLAFTAVWLGLPSPSFPEKASVCRGRCWGRWGREVIWWGRGARWERGVGVAQLSRPEPESLPPFLLLPQPALAMGLGRGEAG